MEHMPAKTYRLSIKEVKKNPGLVADLLLKERDVSLIFEKRGDTVSYAYLKTYDEESIRILREAKKEHEEAKRHGYNREKAFEDFEEARKAIGDRLKAGKTRKRRSPSSLTRM